MIPSELKDRCLAFWARHRSRVIPSFSVLNGDGSLYFVNAGITPFKPLMLRGEDLPVTALVQRCLRTRWELPDSFRFEMMTVVGLADALPANTALLFCLLEEELGLQRERLHCVLDLAEDRLLRLMTGRLPQAHLHHQSGNSELFWTHWDFGHGARLTGLGLTLIWDLGGERACGPSCGVFCACGRHLPLGNIVVVESSPSGRVYFDIGFGVERLCSVFHSGLADAFDPLLRVLAKNETLHLEKRDAALLASCQAAVCLLVEEGVRPAGRGAGYILRKLIRSMYECVYNHVQGDAVEALQNIVSELLQVMEPPLEEGGGLIVSSTIEAEALSYAENIERALPQAKRFLRRSASLSKGDLRQRLRSTYGLPQVTIETLIIESGGHSRYAM